MPELIVELNSELHHRVSEQAARHGYASADAYVHDLIAATIATSEQAASDVNALLKAGLTSGTPQSINEDWWQTRAAMIRTGGASDETT